MQRNRIPTHDLVRPAVDATGKRLWPEHDHLPSDSIPQDHFAARNGASFAGIHILLDFWGAQNLDDLDCMAKALRECVAKCQATLLHIHLHHFSPSGGISGVAVLAESHISVHTWPERKFAAFDIFMCGQTRPEEAIYVLMRAFTPQSLHITENLRGVSRHDRVY